MLSPVRLYFLVAIERAEHTLVFVVSSHYPGPPYEPDEADVTERFRITIQDPQNVDNEASLRELIDPSDEGIRIELPSAGDEVCIRTLDTEDKLFEVRGAAITVEKIPFLHDDHEYILRYQEQQRQAWVESQMQIVALSRRLASVENHARREIETAQRVLAAIDDTDKAAYKKYSLQLQIWKGVLNVLGS